MKYTAISPGSCGEFVQGILGGEEVLTSCGVNLYSKVTLEETKNLEIGPPKSRKALEMLFQKFSLDLKDAQSISIIIESDIPKGKGMASSTADISGVLEAGLKLINKTLTREELGELAAKIEPTDSTIINRPVIFNPTKGEIIKELQHRVEGKILVLEPETTLSTVELRFEEGYLSKKLQKAQEIKEAFKLLEEGHKKKDLSIVGKGATISALANEAIHQKPYLKEIIEISTELGGYGVNVAHSGTVIGILLDSEFKEVKIIERLIAIGISNYYKKLYTLKII